MEQHISDQAGGDLERNMMPSLLTSKQTRQKEVGPAI